MKKYIDALKNLTNLKTKLSGNIEALRDIDKVIDGVIREMSKGK